MKTIFLAAGCFWGSEEYFKRVKGVVNTTVGYANGNTVNPKYEDLKHGTATHAECVKVEYDENVISLEKLLELYFRIIDPFELNHQGEDYGIQYRTGIYYYNDDEKKRILDYVRSLDRNEEYKVEILPLDNFYPAEEYHQDYLEKNPNGYCHVDFCVLKFGEKK